MQLYGVAASSVAASVIGSGRLAELILTERAPPQRVGRLFTMSASKDSGRDLAFVLLSGAHARGKAQPRLGWGNIEHELARAMTRYLLSRYADPASALAPQKPRT